MERRIPRSCLENPGVPIKPSPLRARLLDLAGPLLLLVACLAFFARRARHGLRFTTFGDETMHFVGGQALESGKILYRDFIELHGPLAYAIPQAYGAVFGWREPLHARIILIILTFAAGAAVAASASLRSAPERIVAFAVFLGLTTTLWLVQGLCLYDYQPPAGALLLIGVALCTIPAWFGDPIGSRSLFVAGMCFALTPFLAFSYGPATLLFCASSAWALLAGRNARSLRALGAGGAVGAAIMLCWLLRYADFRGYLVFHFIHAMVDFGPYLHFGPAPALTVLWLPITASNLAQIIGVAAAFIGLAAMACTGAVRRWRPAPFLLGVAGAIMTNPRGGYGFQDGAFVIVAFGIAALALAQFPRRIGLAGLSAMRAAWPMAAALIIAGTEMTARQARSSPQGYLRHDLRDLPPTSLAQSDIAWAQHVRQVTGPGEGILAVPFNPDIYALTGRPPMDRYVYYLPWDADYARHPWFGLPHDLCADLIRNPPPVIYYNGWVVWDRYDPRRYMACLLPILAATYRPMPGAADFFVRTDRMSRLQPYTDQR